MYCQKCGTQMAEGVQFCTNCGAPMNPLGVRMSAANVPLQPASWKRRLANFILDYIGALIFITVLDLITAFAHAPEGLAIFLGIAYFFCYYFLFEGVWQRTPAKWLTGTKVVREDGTKPKFSQIVGRTFSRIIPFEAFSFLVTSHPVGWHDRFPHTLVVSSKLTPDDVKSFNWVEIKKQKNNVVVIVVVCIFAFFIVIGILSTVVLTSLSSARGKAADAEIQSNLNVAQATAEIYKATNNGSYSGVCDNSEDGLTSLVTPKPGSDTPDPYVCNDSDDAWALSAKLSDGTYSCTDSTTDAVVPAEHQLASGQTSCDGSAAPMEGADSQ